MASEQTNDIDTLMATVGRFVNDVNVTDSNQWFLMSALKAMNEMHALLHMGCDGEWQFRKELQPLSNQVTEFIRAIEKRLNVPLPDVSAEELEPLIEQRETCNLHLEHARQTSIALLVHLSLAIRMSEPRQPPKLKVV